MRKPENVVTSHRDGGTRNRLLVRSKRRLEPVSWRQGRWGRKRARGSRALIADAIRRRGTPSWRIAEHPQIERSPLPMCFTEEALETLLTTVGVLPPETGAKGFGPKDAAGFDAIEFDYRGSDWSLGSVYAPDVEWADERRDHHLDQPDHRMRVWSGDIHSHPGWIGQPSLRAGRGLGDLGYVEEVFSTNEWMEWFFIPIVTRTGTSEVVIHPWLCRRGDPPELMIAELLVCDAGAFPEREYNPSWLERLAHAVSPDEEDVQGPMEDDLEETKVFVRVDQHPADEGKIWADAGSPRDSGLDSKGHDNAEPSWFPTAAATAIGLACLAVPALSPVGVFAAGLAVGALAARAFSEAEHGQDLESNGHRRTGGRATTRGIAHGATAREDGSER